jgi:poly(hydroxyalkanoate) granule-associated protein
MVRKLQKIVRNQAAGSPQGVDGALAGAVRESAQQIWLAGMGAFAKAQAEGGKVFDKLVREGLSLQRRTQAVAEERIGEVAGRMTAMADGVTSKAGQKWDRLETIFEQRVEKALHKLGVPSSRDVDTLIRRIDALTAQVEALRKGTAPATAAAKKAAAAQSPTARRTAAQPAPAPASPAPVKRAAGRSASPAAGKVAKTASRATRRTSGKATTATGTAAG